MSKIKPEEITRVKGLGFLRNTSSDELFNARIITGNGCVSSEQFKTIAEAAEKFGSGMITLTTRQTIKIQAIPFDNIEAVTAFVNERGLEIGGTGAKVRPVVSCKGTTCVYGLIDTFALSREIHERFYEGWHEVKLPHKFKIAVGGCPNNCVKPELNDLGVIGSRRPLPDKDKCRACGKCGVIEGCPIKTADRDSDGKINIDPALCNGCGRCKGKCPFGAVDNFKGGFNIFIGGRWGKKIAVGQYLCTLSDKDEVMALIERTLLYYRDNGLAGERFADTITRVGFDNIKAALM